MPLEVVLIFVSMLCAPHQNCGGLAERAAPLPMSFRSSCWTRHAVGDPGQAFVSSWSCSLVTSALLACLLAAITFLRSFLTHQMHCTSFSDLHVPFLTRQPVSPVFHSPLPRSLLLAMPFSPSFLPLSNLRLHLPLPCKSFDFPTPS